MTFQYTAMLANQSCDLNSGVPTYGKQKLAVGNILGKCNACSLMWGMYKYNYLTYPYITIQQIWQFTVLFITIWRLLSRISSFWGGDPLLSSTSQCVPATRSTDFVIIYSLNIFAIEREYTSSTVTFKSMAQPSNPPIPNSKSSCLPSTLTPSRKNSPFAIVSKWSMVSSQSVETLRVPPPRLYLTCLYCPDVASKFNHPNSNLLVTFFAFVFPTNASALLDVFSCFLSNFAFNLAISAPWPLLSEQCAACEWSFQTKACRQNTLNAILSPNLVIPMLSNSSSVIAAISDMPIWNKMCGN